MKSLGSVTGKTIFRAQPRNPFSVSDCEGAISVPSASLLLAGL
jgi:hypothetical protein